jgi:hypothetical protein
VGVEDGIRLKLGVTLGEAAGSIDTDGPILEAIEGNMLLVGSPLGLLLGESETEGDGLGSTLGDVDGAFVCCIDGGVDFIMDGSVLTSVSLILGIPVGKYTISFIIGARVRLVCISGAVVRRSRAEGVLLRAVTVTVGASLGVCDTDGCMLGLEFGSITFNDRLKALWSNPGSVHDTMSNDSFLAKEPTSSSTVPIFGPL